MDCHEVIVVHLILLSQYKYVMNPSSRLEVPISFVEGNLLRPERVTPFRYYGSGNKKKSEVVAIYSH